MEPLETFPLLFVLVRGQWRFFFFSILARFHFVSRLGKKNREKNRILSDYEWNLWRRFLFFSFLFEDSGFSFFFQSWPDFILSLDWEKKIEKKIAYFLIMNGTFGVVSSSFRSCSRTVAFLFFFNLGQISFCLSIGKKKSRIKFYVYVYFFQKN